MIRNFWSGSYLGSGSIPQHTDGEKSRRFLLFFVTMEFKTSIFFIGKYIFKVWCDYDEFDNFSRNRWRKFPCFRWKSRGLGSGSQSNNFVFGSLGPKDYRSGSETLIGYTILTNGKIFNYIGYNSLKQIQ